MLRDEPRDEDIARRRALERHRLAFWEGFARTGQTAQKALIWGAFFLVLYLLRDFFPLIFLTFVFSFIMNSSARVLGKMFPKLGWRPRVIVVFLGFLCAFSVLVALVVPQVSRGAYEIRQSIEDLPTVWHEKVNPWLIEHVQPYRALVTEYRVVEQEVAVRPDETEAAATRPDGTDAPPGEGDPAGAGEGDPPAEAAVEPEPVSDLVAAPPPPRIETRRVTQPVIKEIWEVREFQDLFTWVRNEIPSLLLGIVSVVLALSALFSLLFLATLFSFLIVLDVEGLKREVKKLERTKLDNVYVEVANDLVRFGTVLGNVLEAQAMIALVNAMLTAAGLWVLDIPNIALLSLIVFICGFIPVAGVFISSVPICLVGLYTGGVEKCLILIAFICAIHFLEAYILNPRIMGAALRVNPVLILIILVIGHHALGMWGLLLGLPICYYFFTQVIRRDDREIGLRASFRRTRTRSTTPADA